MYSIAIAVEPRERDHWIAALWDAGTLGIVESDGALQAFFDDADAARAFGEPVACEDVDWVARVQDAWPPLLVGRRFFVVPPWNTDPVPEGRYRLEINPGIQCGTGQHPCTRLCLEALEQMVAPGDAVLDVGSGSGILARAAKILGAQRVIACDVDPDAARAEALRGDQTEEIPFFLGSVDAVRSGAFDIVVANISEAVIEDLRPEFHRVAARRILSGFQDEYGDWTCIIE